MKHLILLAFTLFFSYNITAQVASVNYVIEYDNATDMYDCKLQVIDGQTSTFSQRVQFNSQFTIVVPTGTVISFGNSANPLLDNESQMSTTPADWILSTSAVAPSEQPENDFYAYSPVLTPAASYNDLSAGEEIILFSVMADLDCVLDIRPLDNYIDETLINSEDYTQGFTLGSIDQIYNGNGLPDGYNDEYDVTVEEQIICAGECATLTAIINCGLSNTILDWSTGETTQSITVCPDMTTEYFVTYSDTEGNVDPTNISVLVTVNESPEIVTESTEICVGEVGLFFPEFGMWTSSDNNIATIDEEGELTALSEGNVVITYTDDFGCTALVDVLILPIPIATVTGSDELCIGNVTTLSPSVGGVWISNDENVCTVTNTGVATATGPGIVDLIFQDDDGCNSESITITVYPNPNININGENEICVGETTTLVASSAGEWSSPNTNIATIDSEGIMTGVAPGEVTIQLMDFNTGCIGYSELIIILPTSEITVDSTVYCGGATFQLEPTSNGTWSSSDPSIATVDNNGLVTTVDLGNVCFTYTNSTTGCSSTSPKILIQSCESPCDEVDATIPWPYVPAGEFSQDFNIATYATAPNLIDQGGLDHLVIYDYNTGDVILKENNGNGILDNEILLFNNEDHYANGLYEITLEDMDGDGLTDLILSEANIVTTNGEIGDRLSVYRNNGGADFSLEISEQVCGMAGPQSVRVADFDNDGMKDIFFVCVDYLIDILWINDWSSTEVSQFNEQNFCYPYIGDFNDDGFMDLGFSDNDLYINSGNRIFTKDKLNSFVTGCSVLSYFVEEKNTILDPDYARTIINSTSLETQLCSEHFFGDNENEIFRAYITSPEIESIIIPQVEGFHIVQEQECGLNIEGIPIESVVARQNTKIDLTLNGCTDFLVINGTQINAWINPKQSNKILGTAYIDENGNGVFDAGEPPLRNVVISVSPGDFSVLTDDDGNYTLSVPQGIFTLTATVNEGDWTEDVLTIENISITEPCNEGYNFGFVPVDQPTEMINLSMVNTIARCDFETRFTITAENVGTEPFSGVLVFEFDDRTTFFSSDIQSSQIDGNKVIAMVGPVDPFDPQTYKITVKMPSGSANLPMLDFKVSLLNQFGATVSEYEYAEQLRCSYDPNDKRAYPDREGDDNLTLFDEDLEYTIRFQNNGNDTAFQVKIVDPLDPNIEPSSIRVVSASHAVETCIEGTDLVFLFEDILLVDSMTNYPGSQGYVTFKCNVKNGVTEFTPVENQADIIFDTNEAIVTNQTLNTLVSVLCTDKMTTIAAAICEGEDYNGLTESGTYTETFDLPYGCDSVVTINLAVQGISYTQQNLQACAGDEVTIAGNVYVITENTTITDTSYNDIGCVSNIVTFAIESVVDILGDIAEVSLCDGESIAITPPLEGTWVSNDESIITIDENGNISTVGSGSTTLTFTDAILGCEDDLSVTVSALPEVVNTGSDELCITETTALTSTTASGIWTSVDPNIATVTIDGEVTALVNGSATMIFTDDLTGCMNTILIEVLPASDPECTVSTDDLEEGIVDIYPNPATEMLFIDSAKEWSAVKLVNTNGQVVHTLNAVKTGITTMDIQSYTAGVYMLIFEDGDARWGKRVVIK